MKWLNLLVASACVVMGARNEKLASIYIDDITDPQEQHGVDQALSTMEVKANVHVSAKAHAGATAKTEARVNTALKSKTAASGSPVDENKQIEDDLTRAGLIGGTKTHQVDYRSNADVEDEVADRLTIDYQMDNTLFPTMDHTKTPYAKHAPPLEYVGLDAADRTKESGVYGWVRDFDQHSVANVSGFAFEKGQGFWMDLDKWHKDAVNPESYTIDIVFKLNEEGGMRRVMSKDVDSEEGLYVWGDKIVFWPHILKTNPDAFKQASIKAGQWVRVTLARDGVTKQITGAVDGTPCWVLDDPLGSAILAGKINFFQDNQGYSSSGVLGRVRVFSGPLDYRHIKLAGRHAVDAVYRHYPYGRRIYRNLVVADYHLHNTLISSVFTEYPLFVNNRTFETPTYRRSVVESRGAVVANLPAYGFTYAIDESARLHNFDGNEYTLSAVVKINADTDQFVNLLSWSNVHSEITLRVLNQQLILATRDRGDDLHGTMKTLHTRREKGKLEVGERESDYLQSSQSEFLRLRQERRADRVQAAEIEEQRIREYLEAKAAESQGEADAQKADGPKPRSYWQAREDEKELRVAAGLEPNLRAETRVLSGKDYATKQYEWEKLQSEAAEEARRAELPDTAAARAAAARAAAATTLAAQRTLVRAQGARARSVRYADQERVRAELLARNTPLASEKSFGADGPSEDSANDESEAGVNDAIDDEDNLDLDLDLELDSDLLFETSRSEQEPDLWASEIKAHLPKSTTEMVDKQISDCFLRGGKWRFAPIDKCSLDIPEGQDIEPAPKPYDELKDLASSRTASIKKDKWVQVTITRSLEGKVECYVSGRRAFQYLDTNTTNTEIGGDSIKILTPDAVAPVQAPSGGLARFIVYDQNLRSTEVREMVMGTVWSPPKAINIDRKTGNISPMGTPETVANCITFLPIYNSRSSHPGATHGATMAWVHNACSKDFALKTDLCGEPFECHAQARSWMSCGTVNLNFCMKFGPVSIKRDAF